VHSHCTLGNSITCRICNRLTELRIGYNMHRHSTLGNSNTGRIYNSTTAMRRGCSVHRHSTLGNSNTGRIYNSTTAMRRGCSVHRHSTLGKYRQDLQQHNSNEKRMQRAQPQDTRQQHHPQAAAITTEICRSITRRLTPFFTLCSVASTSRQFSATIV
jgi:hypothetical protein